MDELRAGRLPAARRVRDPFAAASGALAFTFDLPPRGAREVAVVVPLEAAPPNAAPPTQPNPLHVNLYDNVERLKLTVDQILPLHGRKVSLAELQKWIGKAS